jgi:nucleotide-binding universal stress UspA family protein
METELDAGTRTRRSTPQFRSILVPYDYSERAAVAVLIAAELARTHRGRVIVLHVISPSRGILDYPESDAPGGATAGDLAARIERDLTRRVTRSLSTPHAPLECRVVSGDPAARILEAARSADVIVMPTLGRSVVVGVLMGRVAEQVISSAPVPVLTVGPATIRRGAAPATRAPARQTALVGAHG